MLRVFIVSSHLNAAFQALYAKKNANKSFIDVLVIDDNFKKETLLDSIKATRDIHNWDHIIDFSTKIEDNKNLKPTIRQKVMRKVKHFPVISWFYNRLLSRHKKKYTERTKSKIESEFEAHKIDIHGKTELFLLTETTINPGLLSVFPGAIINYMEHGTGDYYYVSKLKTSFNRFYCVFDKTFKNYLEKAGNVNSEKVVSYLEKSDFEMAFKSWALNTNIGKSIDPQKKHVLVLLDAFDCFNPPSNFWTDFIDRCLAEIENKEDYVFLFKPHPRQSNESLEITYKYVKSLNLNFRFLNEKGEASIAVESWYVMFPDSISYVFATFSSAIFYLAKFYPENSRYYVLYDFSEKYTSASPKQYLSIFKEINTMITEVFDEGKIIRLK